MDSLLRFYRETRKRFSNVVEKVDRVHLKSWELDDEYAYSWFGSLADSLNTDMRQGVGSDVAEALFEYMKDQFIAGSADVRNCIDVSFVENLFWQVSPQKAEPYWRKMPDLLKNLYLEFHGSPPC